MTTDRELLELTAKAIGVKLYVSVSRYTKTTKYFSRKDGFQKPWNPLEDDGDALRLATRLHIGIKYYDNAPPELGLPRVCAVAIAPCGRYLAVTPERDDDDAAIRRAIVRAAAEIGRNMG